MCAFACLFIHVSVLGVSVSFVWLCLFVCCGVLIVFVCVFVVCDVVVVFVFVFVCVCVFLLLR